MIIESEFSDNAEGEEIFKKHLTLKFRYDIISTLTIWQRIKYAGVAELHQISDLVVAELVPQHETFDFVEAELVPQSDKASPRCPSQYWRVGSSPISRTSVKDIRFSSVLYFYS